MSKIENFSQFSPLLHFCHGRLFFDFFLLSNRYLTFQLLSSGANKVEDAIECYHRAANMFKMSKNWQQAGSAFCAAGNLHAQAGSRHDAATNYVDASNCFKKVRQRMF
jgi:alpha-soluble NSF attachment protein